MRLWTLHPKYLDNNNLKLLWESALQAREVILDKNAAADNVLQLKRFIKCNNPRPTINYYLHEIQKEGKSRGLNFPQSEVGPYIKRTPINTTTEQLKYEWALMLDILKKESPARWNIIKNFKSHDAHPIFIVKEGHVEIR